MVRWDDLKADVTEVFNEFKKHKIGWIGVSLIGFMVLMGALAPVFAPRVNVEWSPANERWQANPRSSPPVWLDWITRDDYHRHTVLEWDGEEHLFTLNIDEYEDQPERDDIGPGTLEDAIEESLDEGTIHPDLRRIFLVRPERYRVSGDAEVVEEDGELLIYEEDEDGEQEKKYWIRRTGEDEDQLEVYGNARKGEMSYGATTEAFYTHDIAFNEPGNRTLQLRRETEDDHEVLEEGTVQVREREGVENITVEDFTVDPIEGEAPLQISVYANLEHIGDEEEGENRTISLEIGEESFDYELAPGDTVEIDREYTFYTDGLFTVALGEEVEIVKVGVGNDVEVVEDTFRVEIEDEAEQLAATVSAEVRNIVEEERTVRLRIDRELDTGERITEVAEEYTLEGGEYRDISYRADLPEEGTYYFTIGPAEISRTVERDEDEPELFQDGEVEVHSFTFPDEVMVGDIETVTIDLENHYEEQQEITLYIDDEEGEWHFERQMIMAPAGEIEQYEYTFTLDMQSDRVPREIFMEFEGNADRYNYRYLEISRPTDLWEFVQWTGDVEVEDEEITIDMDSDKEIMAHFGEEKYGIRTADVVGNGTVEIDPDQRWYERGEEVDVRAVPGDPDPEYDEDEVEDPWEWEFSHWTGDHPEGEAYEEEITLEMDHDKDLWPVFQRADELEDEHELTMEIEGNGTVDVHGTEVDLDEGETWRHDYQEGTALRIEALADEGWHFDGWGDEWAGIGREVQTLVMDEDTRLTANFDEGVVYDLDVIERGKGSVEVIDTARSRGFEEPIYGSFRSDYEPGDEVTLRAIPDDTIEMEDLDRGDRVGDFHDTLTVVRRTNIRENIYEQATGHLRSEYGIIDVPGQHVAHPTEILFSKDNEDWIGGDAEALKGEYELTLGIEGMNVELEEAETTFSGAVYGVMGTDASRRDIFQGWVWGARYGLIAGGVVALTTIFFGTSFGMTSAYYGGWVDEFMQRLNEILMGIPTLPILIIVLRFWSRSIWVFVLIYALLMWRGAAKVIRSRGLQVAKDTYIEAAESLGSGSGRIIATHMIPQILPYAIAQAALLVPVVIMAEAGLHILGLGDPTIVSWGTLLNEANESGAVYNWRRSWFWILFPGVGMALVGFGFISTGMAIERIINPKMKQR